MVDAGDLKSSVPRGTCGFESRLRHQQTKNTFGRANKYRPKNIQAYILQRHL